MTDMQQRPGTRRAGFTLVEMLVVIAIIAVLVSLSGAAYFKWVDASRRDTTGLTMRSVHQVLKGQMKAVLDQADRDPNLPPSVITMAGGDVRRARVLWKHLRLRQQFPMTYAEARAPGMVGTTQVIPVTDLPPNPTYVRLLAGKNPNAATESSTCLLMAVQQNRGGVSLDLDQLGNAITDTDGDGLKELVDGWGVPVAFFRSPTGSAELRTLNPATAGSRQARFGNPLDPDGLLLNPSWYGSTLRPQFESLTHPISADNGQTALYTIATMVSAGVDGKMGLTPGTMATANAAEVTDNIWSFRLRLGATGD